MKEALLKKRMSEAPKMEPTDAVKLLYQSAFGCGHLIPEDEVCTRRLAAEMAETPPSDAVPAFTPIGNGLCRLNLAAPAVRRLGSARVAAMMRLTAESLAAEPGRFEKDLALLAGLAARGETPFSQAALTEYLTAYRQAGCPPVSHSPAYRAAYRPAYRVVSGDYATLLPLISELDRLGKDATTVVLDGCCGAGKTTLAQRLSRLYDAPVMHMDDFFLPPALRTPERMREPGGNIDYERFSRQVLPGLDQPTAFAYQRFDCQTGALSSKTCPAAPLRVVEGSYALHPRFQAAYDRMNALTVFLDTEPEEQLRRLKTRNPERFQRFQEEWIPLEKSYFQAYDIRGRAKLKLYSLPWEG